uniref:mitogen-activated protein kinase kinase n=1 Tax=Syphacia muris TaxID=451379 RepID=A0A0N5AKD8_9BILA
MSRRRNPLKLNIDESASTVPATSEEESTSDDENKLSIEDKILAELHLQSADPRIGTNLFEDLKEEKLQKLSDLGHGNGGVVHKVLYIPTKTVMARKLIHLEVNHTLRQQILKELSVLYRCNSPYIVGFYGAFIDNYDLSICMEYMDGLSLDVIYKKSGPIKESLIGQITSAVLKGLSYLKETHQILHRDIKPSNILVNTRGEIKLCDFGVSAVLIDSMATSFVGTRSYMAPERLTGCRYNVKSDIWSFGITLVEIAIARYPVPAPTVTEYRRLFNLELTDQLILGNGQSPPESLNAPSNMSIFDFLNYVISEPSPSLPRKIFSDAFVDFVEICLKKELAERANLKALLNHQFYTLYSKVTDHSELAEFVRCNIESSGDEDEYMDARL